jgi:hypothetical protein
LVAKRHSRNQNYQIKAAYMLPFLWNTYTQMKNLKLLFIAFLAITTISSCSKDSDNGLGDYEENLKRIDSILKEQAPILKEYAEHNFG